jgi:hypothetical protein
MLERRIGAQMPTSNFQEQRIRPSVQSSSAARSNPSPLFFVLQH